MIEYGGMPPRFEFVKVQRLTAPKEDGSANIYNICAGAKEKMFLFCWILQLRHPHLTLRLNIPYF